MIAKPADDSSSRLRILEALLDSPRLDVQQKRQLAEYIDRKKIGLNGERQAAHFIDSYLATRDNHQVIHDLRIEADGDTAQIDHLIIGRGFHLFLLETKNFGGDVNINDRGEFSVRYGHKVYGIPSPIEQSRRHEIVLLKVLERIGISGRLASKPKVFHAVLLHPRATITRPASDRFDSSCVIKADQFEEWRLKKIDDVSVAGMLGMIANIVSTQTIAEWARALVAEHQPENPLALPEWLAPRELPAPVKALRAERNDVREARGVATGPQERVSGASEVKQASLAKKLVCADCGEKISYAEGKYCWNHEQRFGGLQYCRAHQAGR